MSEKCIFCRIIDGSLPASFIYSDDLCVSFMDIQPVNPGHILVIPRDHTALIGALKDFATKDDFEELWLPTNKSNKAAVEFYKRMGDVQKYDDDTLFTFMLKNR